MMNLKSLKPYVLFSFLLMSLCVLVNNEASAQSGDCTWKVVAAEHQGLNMLPGPMMVRYGTPDNYVEKMVSPGMGCNNITFGDPHYGVHKLCWACEDMMPSSSCWTIVASEHRTISLPGTQMVRFGTATQYVEKMVTNGQKCNSLTFGSDPAPGKRKQCSTCPNL